MSNGSRPDKSALGTVLESVPVTVFGDSYGSNPSQGVDAGQLPVDRIARRYRTQTPVNWAAGGTRMDQALAAIQLHWTANGRGLVWFADGCINDVRGYAADGGRTTTAEAFRSCLAYLTAWSLQAYSGAAFVFGPGWSAGVSSTVGSYVDFAWTGDACYLLVGFVTTSGGTVTITNEAGATLATVATGNYWSAFTGAVKLSGLGSGSRTLRATLTAGSATIAGLIVPGANAPTIVWQRPGRYVSGGQTEATRLALYQSACDAIAADFPTLITFSPGAGWDYTTMIAADQIHPNERGVAYLTDQANTLLRARITAFREGLNWLSAVTSTAANGTYTNPAVSYTGASATVPSQVASVVATTGQQVVLTWARPADGGATLTGFVVQSSPAGAGTWTTAATPAQSATGVTLATGFTASSSYDFRVLATNAIGSGPYSTTATATAGAQLTVYATDTFTRADAAALGTTETGSLAWVPNGVSTVWSILTNRAQLTAGVQATNDPDVHVDTTHSDGSVTATLRAAVTSGLVFRMAGTNNATGYIFWRNGANYILSKRTAKGSYTQLGITSGITSVVGDVMTVVANGTSIICKINGTTQITVTDASYTGTRWGLWSSGAGAIFDDFTVDSAAA